MFAAGGLKCYQCASSISMDDCFKNKTEETCKDGYECVTVTSGDDDKGHLYSKGCNDVLCLFPGACCDEDLCNSGTVTLVSAFMLLACALVNLVRLV